MAEEREREEETPDETFGEVIREETAKHGEPPPKPSVFEMVRERVKTSVEGMKARRAAEAEERKEIEAAKKEAIMRARQERKTAETEKEIKEAYEKELYKKSTAQKLAEGVQKLRPMLAGMKAGISSMPTTQRQPKRYVEQPSQPPSWLTGGSYGGFDVTKPVKVRRYEGSGRLAILSTPTKGGPLHSLLFQKPARKMGKMGKKGSLPSLFSPSKMGVRIPKGSIMGLNLPKQGKSGRKSRNIFGY